MELKTCPNGHTYDPSVSSSCPICNSGANMGVGSTIPADVGHTIPLGTFDMGSGMSDVGSTIPLDNIPNIPTWGAADSVQPDSWSATIPVGEGWANAGTGASAPDGHTPTAAVNVGIGGVYAKSQPLTGWLVCIDGVEKGKDYRIHEEYNYIGRSPKMDICIAGDGSVSWERHAIIAYDREERMFFFAPSSGGSIVRHNGRAVLNNVQLKAGDQLKIGNSTFMFVPFCGETFQWEE